VDDSLKLLEEKVERAAGRLKHLQAEAAKLRAEVADARGRAETAERKLAQAEPRGGSARAEALGRELAGLRTEREELRARIAKLVELLGSLE
jgi:chromosome segregation ATPase